MLGDETRIARCTVGRQMGLRGVTQGKAVTTTGSDKAAPCRLTASTASSGPRRRTCCGSATSPAARAAAGLDGRARPLFRQDLRQGIAKREHSLEHFSIKWSRLIERKCSLIEEVEHYSRSNWIGKCSRPSGWLNLGRANVRAPGFAAPFCTRGRDVGANRGAVEHLHEVRCRTEVRQHLEECLEDTATAQPREPLPDSVPVAVFRRKGRQLRRRTRRDRQRPVQGRGDPSPVLAQR